MGLEIRSGIILFLCPQIVHQSFIVYQVATMLDVLYHDHSSFQLIKENCRHLTKMVRTVLLLNMLVYNRCLKVYMTSVFCK